MKRCFAPLVVWEMQIKNHNELPLHIHKHGYNKKDNKYWQEWEETETTPCQWECKMIIVIS
jgi:hypothetical protein